MTTAFQLALPPPATTGEETLERAYQAATRAARSLGDASAGATLSDLDNRVRALRDACREVRFAWTKASSASAFGTRIPAAAIHMLGTVLEGADLERVPNAEDLYGELVKFETLSARAQLSASLRAAQGERSLRQIARETGLASGYLSQLANGVKGPPSTDVARTLDRALGSNLVPLVENCLSRIEAKKADADRVRAATKGVPASMSPLVRATEALAGDTTLLQLVDELGQLEAEARRMLLGLIRALRLKQ